MIVVFLNKTIQMLHKESIITLNKVRKRMV